MLAIIPARGGSKGLPRKNIVPLGGQPLIAWALATAQNCSKIHRVVVSTEDKEIKQIALNYGAEVIDRPEELAQDETPIEDVLRHVFTKVTPGGFACLIQPTSPFILPYHITLCYEKLMASQDNSVMTCIEPEHKFHPFNIRDQLDSDLHLEFMFPASRAASPRRQDKPQVWSFGNCIVFYPTFFLQEGELFLSPCSGVPISRLSAWDIDTEEDLDMAQAFVAAGLI